MAKVNTSYNAIPIFEGNVARDPYINYNENKVGFRIKSEHSILTVNLTYEEAMWLSNQLKEDAITFRDHEIKEQEKKEHEKMQVLINENDKFYVRGWNLPAPVYGPFNSLKEARHFRDGFDTTESLGRENYIIEVK